MRKVQTRYMEAPPDARAVGPGPDREPPRGAQLEGRVAPAPATGGGREDVAPAVASVVGPAPVWERVAACRLCAPRFAATATAHEPRPVVWFRPGARLLIASQAPGLRAHNGGRPFMDPSGVRLRAWIGVGEDEFYDLSRVAIIPMGFCFPGYDAAGGDIPPPAVCAQTWRAQALAAVPSVHLTLLVGGMAQAWHLGRMGVTDRVRRWREHAPSVFPLPHPSWRNTAWLKANPWFEAEALPALRARVREVLAEDASVP